MQPKFRSIVWRELPPFVRRFCVGWSRSLFHAELAFGRLYLSWTKSPTWNFVGIAGTLGIILTILLFLAPREFTGESLTAAGRPGKSRLDQHRRPWELDATLTVASQSHAYPVEIEFDHQSRPVREIPVLAQEAPDLDWFDDAPRKPTVVAADPPRLGLDLEVVRPTRRRRREPEVADVSFSARAEPVDQRFARNRDGDFDPDDPWRRFDPSHVAVRDELRIDPLTDDQAMAVPLDADAAGSLWEPPPLPGSASSAVEIELELSWDRTAGAASRRRQRPSQLHIRNLGPAAIPRIDVLRGGLAETDFTVPQRLVSQTLPELPPGQEHAVASLAATGRTGFRVDVVSVLVTAFVGNQTTATAAVVVNDPPPRQREPAPARQANRPHLTLTTGDATRLREHQMLTVPMRVVNDGNVTLDDVAIIAEIPSTLEHRYGRTVHLRIGTLRPNEDRRTSLLLTPLAAGAATVKLNATDGEQTAADDGVVELEITAHDVAEPPAAPSASRRTSAAEPRSRAPRRRP